MSDFTPSFSKKIPPGDDRERSVCNTCGFVDYQNPKIVAGAVVVYRGKILMCRRAIEPRRGYWTLPAGYMELGETVEEGAMREAREEAEAEIVIDGFLALFSVPRIGQVHTFFAAHLETPDFGVGVESLETELFDWENIPWSELAFPTVKWALNAYQKVRDRHEAGESFPPAFNPPDAGAAQI